VDKSLLFEDVSNKKNYFKNIMNETELIVQIIFYQSITSRIRIEET